VGVSSILRKVKSYCPREELGEGSRQRGGEKGGREIGNKSTNPCRRGKKAKNRKALKEIRERTKRCFRNDESVWAKEVEKGSFIWERARARESPLREKGRLSKGGSLSKTDSGAKTFASQRRVEGERGHRGKSTGEASLKMNGYS